MEGTKGQKGGQELLQTVAFFQVFMRPGQGITYSDVKAPLRRLNCKHTRFVWSRNARTVLWS